MIAHFLEGLSANRTKLFQCLKKLLCSRAKIAKNYRGGAARKAENIHVEPFFNVKVF